MRKFVSLLAAIGLLVGGSVASSAPSAAAPNPAAPTAVRGVDRSFGKLPRPPKPDPSRDKPQAANPRSFTKGVATPNLPEIGSAKRSACSGPCYFYAGRYRATSNVSEIAVIASGITASVDQQDYHSLWETTVQATDGTHSNACNIVELGMNRDRVVNGDTYPALTTHLFGSVWYCDASGNRTFCGYNGGCGYTDYASNPINLGADISAIANVQKTFRIIHDDTTHLWWLWYDTDWIGYFPDNLTHSQTFTRSTLSQTFDEGAWGHDPSCSDEGNSWLADSTASPETHKGQQVFSYNDDSATSGTLALAAYTGSTISLAAKWNVSTISNYSYYAGGPGYSPNPGACP